ncbi:16S rRNA (guanine(527)-N(7))-methyltransferase RsmG [bacterium]|nr:16S rRNA (guanine(527)-N(7))-methyltransferase RsmG [bacterium]
MQGENRKALIHLCVKARLSDGQPAALHRYVELVERWSGRCNLVSKNDLNRIAAKHVADSWNFTRIPGLLPGVRALDVGSGAGFPGVVLALLRPDVRVTLLDSRRQRTLFLREAVEQLGLANAQVLCQRVEELHHSMAGFFNLVTGRAVAGLEELWQWAQPLLQPQGFLITQKGLQEEIEPLTGATVESIPMLYTISASRLLLLRKEGSSEKQSV